MKRVLTIFSSVLFLMSCGNNADTKVNSTSSDSTKTAEVKDPDAAKGLELITKSDCFTCHKLTQVGGSGPTYAAVAEKYKTLDQPAMDSMVKQIINGGAGRWGTIPMTPHKDMPRADAELMVHYIMSIKK
ncbi:MAG: c-type cytochrome [Ginsengibacter sp.]